MRRELREEAGLHLPVLEPFAVEQATGTDGTCVPIQIFTGRWNGDPDSLPLTEGVMLAWVHPDKLPQMLVPPSTLELVRRHAAAVAPRRPATTVPGGRTVPGGTVLHVVGVHLYLEREGKVLLGLRHTDSAFAGSTWHFLAGHCEAESAVACLVREAREEAGLVIDPSDVELVHVVHVVDRQGDQPRMQVVFRARRWEGAPEVREPDKCVAWEWWSAKDLPEPIVAYAQVAIDGIREGRPYSELGF